MKSKRKTGKAREDRKGKRRTGKAKGRQGREGKRGGEARQGKAKGKTKGRLVAIRRRREKKVHSGQHRFLKLPWNAPNLFGRTLR